jgi:hypothetical protein
MTAHWEEFVSVYLDGLSVSLEVATDKRDRHHATAWRRRRCSACPPSRSQVPRIGWSGRHFSGRRWTAVGPNVEE